MDSTAWNHQDSLPSSVKPKKFWWDHLFVKILLGFLAVNLVLLNVLVIKEKFFDKGKKIQPEVSLSQPETKTKETLEIEALRQDLEAMNATMAAKLACLASPLPIALSTPTQTATTKKLTHKLETIAFPAGQSANSQTWWDTPSMKVTFNAASYPNYTAYWEALMKVKGGEGKAYARLFDVNANIPLVGSEIETSAGDLVRVSSGSLTFWPENRTYRVQMKSLSGAEAVVEDAKIVISWIKEE